MKVFASDLDQTLIYSKRWISDANEDIRCIEIYKDEALSFMLFEEIEELKSLSKSYEFIPITTRTRSQYERVDLPINPKYAVVANGACIIKDGLIDEKWEKIIRERLDDAMSTHDMYEKLQNLLKQEGAIRLRDADGLFLYLITDLDTFDRTILNKYRDFVESGKWSIHDQGKKVYFVPQAINKGDALKYLREKNDYKHIVSAGDSDLDESLKKASDYFIAPEHSKFEANYKCSSKGIDNGLEIVKNAKKYLDNK